MGIIILMTTFVTKGTIRVFVNKGNKLDKECELCLNKLCTLDVSRIHLKNLLTTLQESEMLELESKLQTHLALNKV